MAAIEVAVAMDERGGGEGIKDWMRHRSNITKQEVVELLCYR